MAGIYVHIPFCKRACHYCDFHFSTSVRYKNDLVLALLKEIELQQDYLTGEQIETIYFGGGTPSLLSAQELFRIMQGLRNHFSIVNDAEITLEANPDDINDEQLNNWSVAGINRLSIGIQSFYDQDLLWMNRAHNGSQALESVERAKAAGFNNLSIDLIYGTPILDDIRWQHNVEQAILLNIPHLSCYALTVEPKTFLSRMISKRQSEPVDPEKQAKQFLLLMEWLEYAGFEAYEISNYARPGLRSRHNSAYWQGKKYLGLGPSAHSFNGLSRQWNISNNQLYIRNLRQEKLPFELEILTDKQKFNEYVMTALRTSEGIDTGKIRLDFGEKEMKDLNLRAAIFIQAGKLDHIEGQLALTREGRLFADGIAAALFV